MDKAEKYDMLIGILMDNAWVSAMNDKLIFNDTKLSMDVRSFLMAFEPELYEQRFIELRR